jgi:hypothetical protein
MQVCFVALWVLLFEIYMVWLGRDKLVGRVFPLDNSSGDDEINIGSFATL